MVSYSQIQTSSIHSVVCDVLVLQLGVKCVVVGVATARCRQLLIIE